MILDALLDGIIDSVKLLPFLFLTYLLMEFLESRMNDKTKDILHKSGKTGPVWGAVLGMMPQCGFSAAASNLYAGRMITMGTLIAIYLSTSDEMLPILISEAVNPLEIIKILLLKVVIGMIVGVVVDFILNKVMKKQEREVDIHHFCEHEHCHCGHGIIRPALRHSLQIFFFIFVISTILNLVIGWVGTEALSDFIMNKPVLGEMLAGLIGLIPNCAASVVITQLYLDGIIQFGTMMSGLLVGAGVGVLVLFRVNGERKENLKIVGILYGTGVVAGIILNLFL